MILIETEIFGGAKCARVASLLGKKSARTWVFSVCSDERIPAEFEKRLSDVQAVERPSRLIILGDFPTIPPERSPASFEAIRLVAKVAGFKGTIQVCWLDAEEINFKDICLPPLVWHKFICSQQQREEHVWPIEHPNNPSENDACKKIIKLLGKRPGIRISDDGTVEALNFTDGEAYRRSLALGLSVKAEVMLWSQIKRLTCLRELRVGFSELRAIPDLSCLKFLEILDLRGNPGIRLEEVHKIASLKKLNLAACELYNVPYKIEDLFNLKTLLLHKNRIEKISTVKFPLGLKRLSLYRNQIETCYLDLSKNEMLREINLGANPFEFMIVDISDELNSLSLRLRHVRDRVAVKCCGKLGTSPAIFLDC